MIRKKRMYPTLINSHQSDFRKSFIVLGLVWCFMSQGSCDAFIPLVLLIRWHFMFCTTPGCALVVKNLCQKALTKMVHCHNRRSVHQGQSMPWRTTHGLQDWTGGYGLSCRRRGVYAAKSKVRNEYNNPESLYSGFAEFTVHSRFQAARPVIAVICSFCKSQTGESVLLTVNSNQKKILCVSNQHNSYTIRLF
jgi:hypothetical protein